VLLAWDIPTFGQVTYKVYRGESGATPTLLAPLPLAPPITITSYPDSPPKDCTTYTYFVSSVLTVNGNEQESVPSNSQQYSVPCPPPTPPGLTAKLTVTNGVGSIALSWNDAPTASGPIGQYNVYRDDGSGSVIQLLSPPGLLTTSYTDQPVVNNRTYTYYVTAASEVLNDQLVNGQQYCPPGQNCRESSAAITTISVNWMVDSITTITSIVPGPSSILGQPLTVSVTVSPAVGTSPPWPIGTVTVSDSGGPICPPITLSGGSGSCTGTPSILLIGGLAAVGTRTISATYSGDLTFNGSSGSKDQQVIYNFNGFLSPLKLSSFSGSFNFGKTIPIKWQLKTYTGTYITMSNLDLTKVSLTAFFNGQPSGGVCPVSPVSGKTLVLYNFQQGAAGGSTFRYDATNNQYLFNWDTSKANFGTGCYTLSLIVGGGSAPKTTSLLSK